MRLLFQTGIWGKAPEEMTAEQSPSWWKGASHWRPSRKMFQAEGMVSAKALGQEGLRSVQEAVRLQCVCWWKRKQVRALRQGGFRVCWAPQAWHRLQLLLWFRRASKWSVRAEEGQDLSWVLKRVSPARVWWVVRSVTGVLKVPHVREDRGVRGNWVLRDQMQRIWEMKEV